MKSRPVGLRLALAGFIAALGAPGWSADAPAASTGAVELPPMLVEESVSTVPWLYVSAGGTEFLSRCAESTTEDFVKAWLAKMQLVHVLIPDGFLARMDVPSIFVLYAQDLKQTVSAEIQRELQGGDATRGVSIAPSMRLIDRDMHASIAYIDESLFDANGLSVSGGHVRYLLQRRVPELPAWLLDSIERTWRGADFVLEPITLAPLAWSDRADSDGLAGDPTWPRALLPASELFASGPERAIEREHPRHAATRAATEALFFRWANVSGGAMREAFWRFAARAAQEPVTERMFEANFGFDFAELRDRLSDYVPKAVKQTARIEPGKLPAPPPFEVQRATPNQIARVRGEWERLAIGHVQRRLPQAREPYVAQARRTLRRAYDAGDRDPRLLATMGLCEIDAGNPGGAREFLEPAVLAGVVRPRAYYELARLRFMELRREGPETKLFSFTELAPVIDPLRRALTQAPPLPEIFVLLAEAWERCAVAPTATEFTELQSGVRWFPQRAAVAYPVARVLARHGKKSEALAALDACAATSMEQNTREGIARLRAELAAASTLPAAEK